MSEEQNDKQGARTGRATRVFDMLRSRAQSPVSASQRGPQEHAIKIVAI